MRSSPDLVQENPGQSDAFGRWTKTGVEQADDLHHDLSLVVELLHHAPLQRLYCWPSCCEENALLAKLEVSSTPFVSQCDQWAVAWLNKC